MCFSDAGTSSLTRVCPQSCRSTHLEPIYILTFVLQLISQRCQCGIILFRFHVGVACPCFFYSPQAMTRTGVMQLVLLHHSVHHHHRHHHLRQVTCPLFVPNYLSIITYLHCSWQTFGSVCFLDYEKCNGKTNKLWSWHMVWGCAFSSAWLKHLNSLHL